MVEIWVEFLGVYLYVYYGTTPSMASFFGRLGNFTSLADPRDSNATRPPDVYDGGVAYSRAGNWGLEDSHIDVGRHGQSLRSQFFELQPLRVPTGAPNQVINADILREAMDPNNSVSRPQPVQRQEDVPDWFMSALTKETWTAPVLPDQTKVYQDLANMSSIMELGPCINQLTHLSDIARAKLFYKLMTMFSTCNNVQVINAFFSAGPLQEKVLNLLMGIDIGCAKEEKTVDSCCPVCHEDYEDGEELVRLGCQHLFHPACIGKWLYNFHNTTCPMCKASVPIPRNPNPFQGGGPLYNQDEQEQSQPEPSREEAEVSRLLPMPESGTSADGRVLDTFSDLSEETVRAMSEF